MTNYKILAFGLLSVRAVDDPRYVETGHSGDCRDMCEKDLE